MLFIAVCLLAVIIDGNVYEWKITNLPDKIDNCFATSNSNPCSRSFAASTQEENTLLIFGGSGNNKNYNDFWSYNIQQERWIYHHGGYGGEFEPNYSNQYVCTTGTMPLTKHDSMMTHIGNNLVAVYGGQTENGFSAKDLFYFDYQDNCWVFIYGQKGMINLQPIWENEVTPGGRRGGALLHHDEYDILIMMFGYQDGQNIFSDVFYYDIRDNLWSFVAGTSGRNKKTESPDRPGCRKDTVAWWTPDGTIQFYGGYGCDTLSGLSYLSDLWEYDLGDAKFKHQAGTLTPNVDAKLPAGYDHQYVNAKDYWPAARSNHAAVKVNSDEVVIFGGASSAVSEYTLLFDIWHFKISTLEIKFVRESVDPAQQKSVYDQKYEYHPDNLVGSRIAHSLGYNTVTQDVILFAGKGLDINSDGGKLNDVWTYQFCERCGDNATCVDSFCQCDTGYDPDGDPLVGCEPFCTTCVGAYKNAYCYDVEQCICEEWYEGIPADTGCSLFCSPLCGVNATCVYPNNCTCPDYYEGNPLVECKPMCVNNICGENAICVDVDVCECPDGFIPNDTAYFPDICAPLYSCDNPTNCNSNATCMGEDKCICNNGWDGDGYFCNPICTGQFECVDNATCILPNTCICDFGYDGFGSDECIPDCGGTCGENSFCFEPNTCKCNDGYEYKNMVCVPECSKTCNEFASCEFRDNCTCNEGYSGDGINTCSPICDQCPSEANCLTPGNCVCPDGFALNFGKTSCIPLCVLNESCSDFAFCESPGLCKCFPEYTGDPYTLCEAECKLNNPKGCGNNAICIEKDVCVCPNEHSYNGDPWSDEGCIAICNPDCGVNAFCESPDVCVCEEGYIEIVEGVPIAGCKKTCSPPCHKEADCIIRDEDDDIDFHDENDYIGLCVCKNDLVGNGRECDTLDDDNDDENNGNNGIFGENSLYFYIGIGAGAAVLALVVIITFIVITICVCIIVKMKNSKKRMTEMELKLSQGKAGSTNSSLVPGSFRDKFARDDEVQEDQEETIKILNELGDNVFVVEFDSVNLLKQIGKGGGGANIFLADWEGKKTAFKVFHAISGHSQQFRAEFIRELQILSALAHPNIVQFYGICVKAPRIGILIEFCSHGDLEDFIMEKKLTLSQKEKFKILSGISAGMSYIHKRSIIHRDLKPKNVLLDNDLNPKIIDFGLSRVKTASQHGMTTRIGTCNYMPPEITLGMDYSRKCDVFSFAIMAYEVLTENFDPYNSLNGDFVVENKVANDPTFRPNLMNKTFVEGIGDNNWVADLLTRCWSSDPEERMEFKEIQQKFKGTKEVQVFSNEKKEFSQKKNSIEM